MSRGAKLVLLVAPMAALTLAGCATTGGTALRSADRLDRNSRLLAQDARDQSISDADATGSTLAHDSRELARRARRLRRTLQERESIHDPDVRSAFDAVSRSYHEVREDVQRTGDREERRELRPVTQAYLDTEDQMGGYPPDHRYADDEDDGSGY